MYYFLERYLPSHHCLSILNVLLIQISVCLLLFLCCILGALFRIKIMLSLFSLLSSSHRSLPLDLKCLCIFRPSLNHFFIFIALFRPFTLAFIIHICFLDLLFFLQAFITFLSFPPTFLGLLLLSRLLSLTLLTNLGFLRPDATDVDGGLGQQLHLPLLLLLLSFDLLLSLTSLFGLFFTFLWLGWL